MRDYEFLQLCMTNTITEADGPINSFKNVTVGGFIASFKMLREFREHAKIKKAGC